MSRPSLIGAVALFAALSGVCWAQDAAETATLTAGMAAGASAPSSAVQSFGSQQYFAPAEGGPAAADQDEGGPPHRLTRRELARQAAEDAAAAKAWASGALSTAAGGHCGAVRGQDGALLLTPC